MASGSSNEPIRASARQRHGVLVVPLALLEARRVTATGLLVAALAAALVLATRSTHSLPFEVQSGLGADAAQRAAGAVREAAWFGVLVMIVPFGLLHAASIVPRWRRGESDWLGARPAGRAAVLTSTFVGYVGGLVLLLALVGTVIEAGSGRPPGVERAFSAGPAEPLRLEPGQHFAHAFDLVDVDDGSLLRVRVRPSLGAAPTTDARLEIVCTTPDGVDERSDSGVVRIAFRGWIEAHCPAGTGALALSVSCLGEGALTVEGPRPIEIWSPGGGHREAALRVGLRTLLALAAFGALAFGLGAWLAAPIAAAGAAAFWLVATGATDGSAWLPGSGLLDALGALGEGRVPDPLDVRSVPIAAVVVVASLALATPGLRSWRHPR